MCDMGDKKQCEGKEIEKLSCPVNIFEVGGGQLNSTSCRCTVQLVHEPHQAHLSRLIDLYGVNNSISESGGDSSTSSLCWCVPESRGVSVEGREQTRNS